MRIGRKVVLLLALFKHQQQRPLSGVKSGVFQGLLDKLRLAGIQESGKGINRNLLHGLHPKQNGDALLIQLRANYAQLAGDGSAAATKVDLLGNHIEVDPGAISGRDDTLGPQDHAVLAGIQHFQSFLYRITIELLMGLNAPGSKHLIGVMMIVAAGTVFTVLMVVMMLLMVVAAAAMLTMLMVVMMFLVMVATAAMLTMLMMVMMFLVMVAAATMLTMLMMVMMFLVMVTAAAMLTMLMMVMMLLVMMAAATMTIMVMMLLLQASQVRSQRSFAFHSLDQLLTGQLVPGGSNDSSRGIMLPDHRNRSIQLSLRDSIGTGQDDGGCCFDLVVIEFTKVLHVNLDLAGVDNRNSIAQSDLVIGDLIDRGNHIGQLTNTGGFDNDSVRIILFDHLGQCFTEIAHQAAADTAGVHFSNIDASILQETAVNADLTEFILDEYQFLALVGFLDHFLNERCLARSQETGVNIDLCHCATPSIK